MAKQIQLFAARAGMEPAAFASAGPSRLLPTLQAVPHLTGLAANIVIPGATVEGAHIAETPPPPDFNLIASLWFDGGAAAPPVRLSEDLVDAAKTRTFLVEEHESAAASLGSKYPVPNDPAQVKMICMIKRRPGMSRAAFIDYYETGHAPLTARYLPMIAGYRRNYPLEGESIGIDVLTEMYFRTTNDHQALLTALGDPQLGDMFAEDEKNLFDRNSIQMFLVTEHCFAPPHTAIPAA